MFRDQDWISPNRAEQMDGPSYMGPCTFMKTMTLFEPSELDQFRPDIAIVGAPWDSTTSWRAGTRLGPRAIRTANWTYPFYHLDLDVAPFDELRVIDYGDAVCPPGMCEAAEHAIWQRVTEVASRGIFPVVLGGEHSITYPSAKAVADVVGHGKLGVIHFDAHADTVPEMFGNLYSHGTPMRRLIESGAVPGKNFVQIGLRGYWPPRDVLDWMKLQGMRWHLMSKVRTVGTQAVIEEAIEQALNGPEMIYISLDIDVLDPGFAPGCTNPEPGGMTPGDLLWTMQRLVEATNVIAMDVVEVCPPYDSSELAAQNANRAVMQVLSALAVKRRKATKAGQPARHGSAE
jgi:agmatinase